MRYPGYKYFYLFIDIITISLSYFLSHYIYHAYYTNRVSFVSDISFTDIYILIGINFLFVMLFHYFHLYKMNVFLTRSNQIAIIIKSLFYGISTIIILSFIFKEPIFDYSRLLIGIFFLVLFFMLFISRVLILYNLYSKILSKNIFERRILIIGAGESGQFFAQKLSFENVYGVKILGFLDDNVEVGTKIFNDLEVLGCSDDLDSIFNESKFEELVICISNIKYGKLLGLIDKCKKINVAVKVTSDLFGIIGEKVFTESYENIPVFDVTSKVNVSLYYVFKRIMDYFGASIGIILLSPFFAIASLIIKLTSNGPVIYKQKRIGKNGKVFNFYKFRSMEVIKGEDVDRKKKMIEFIKNGNNNLNGKILNEERVTNIGKFLRKYSLDELPQLFNVIKGDMSLVGPRPCLPYEFENYIDWQKRRLSVLPGCTGLWQVSGRSEVNFNDSVVMDIYYINNITPWLDLQLIFKTIPVMLFAKGGK